MVMTYDDCINKVELCCAKSPRAAGCESKEASRRTPNCRLWGAKKVATRQRWGRRDDDVCFVSAWRRSSRGSSSNREDSDCMEEQKKRCLQCQQGRKRIEGENKGIQKRGKEKTGSGIGNGNRDPSSQKPQSKGVDVIFKCGCDFGCCLEEWQQLCSRAWRYGRACRKTK